MVQNELSNQNSSCLFQCNHFRGFATLKAPSDHPDLCLENLVKQNYFSTFNSLIMDRKEFFTKILLGGTVLFVAPAVIESCSKSALPAPSGTSGSSNPQTIDLSSPTYSSLQTVGGYAYLGNIIVIRTGQSSYAALSKVCTHQGCTVTYNSSANEVSCPCHGSLFSITGAVVQGPAPVALKSYNVTVSGSTLSIG